MCGVFGAVFVKGAPSKNWNLEDFVLLALSVTASRGKEACGVAFLGKKRIDVLKRPCPADEVNRDPMFSKLLDTWQDSVDELHGVMGHSRLVTNGSSELHENNQPVLRDDSVLIHNGIIVNVDDLFARNKDLTRKFEVDSEVISALLDARIQAGSSLSAAVSDVFENIEGQATIAYTHKSSASVVLATNNGSLHYFFDENAGVLLFASERVMLRRLLASKTSPLKPRKGQDAAMTQLLPGRGLSVVPGRGVAEFGFNSDGGGEAARGNLERAICDHRPSLPLQEKKSSFMKGWRDGDRSLLEFDEKSLRAIRRCTKCLLPESFPGLVFDAQGVCNYCHSYTKLKPKGEQAFLDALGREAGTGKPGRCIVALSGGRDSCYILHVLKKELGLDVIAYTYDWGMVTDLARRNMSRMVAKLGVEHILISADIAKKRSNIRKNVLAWLERPNLGTVPLFMAGDKQFFYYANAVLEQNDAQHLIFGMNRLERTDFKTGFCGVVPRLDDATHFALAFGDKAKVLSFYVKEVLLNPRLVNSSLVDTAFGFFSYYVIPHRYQQFFDYFSWNEEELVSTLRKEYDWEVAEDTRSTWRIGDGTASFYNYIYLKGAGFTEVDTFRSNQIRQGILSRDQGFELMIEENRPRLESFRWYCDTIGIDFRAAAKKINEWANGKRP